MTVKSPVSDWIDAIRRRDGATSQEFWHRYFSRLVRLAQRQLRNAQSTLMDGEDIAASVLAKFYEAATNKTLPLSLDHDSLWRLLVCMSTRKVIDHFRYSRRHCRAFDDSSHQRIGVCEVQDVHTRSPCDAAMMNENLEAIFELLDDPERIEIVVAKMKGFTNDDIAIQLNCSLRTVERRLLTIRQRINQHYTAIHS